MTVTKVTQRFAPGSRVLRSFIGQAERPAKRPAGSIAPLSVATGLTERDRHGVIDLEPVGPPRLNSTKINQIGGGSREAA
jgi:hypothetical protein